MLPQPGLKETHKAAAEPDRACTGRRAPARRNALPRPSHPAQPGLAASHLLTVFSTGAGLSGAESRSALLICRALHTCEWRLAHCRGVSPSLFFKLTSESRERKRLKGKMQANKTFRSSFKRQGDETYEMTIIGKNTENTRLVLKLTSWLAGAPGRTGCNSPRTVPDSAPTPTARAGSEGEARGGCSVSSPFHQVPLRTGRAGRGAQGWPHRVHGALPSLVWVRTSCHEFSLPRGLPPTHPAAVLC